ISIKKQASALTQFGSAIDVEVRYLRRSSIAVAVNQVAKLPVAYSVDLFTNRITLNTAPAVHDIVTVTYEVAAPSRVVIPDSTVQTDAPGNEVVVYGRNTGSVTGSANDYFGVEALDGDVDVTWQSISAFTILQSVRASNNTDILDVTDKLT